MIVSLSSSTRSLILLAALVVATMTLVYPSPSAADQESDNQLNFTCFVEGKDPDQVTNALILLPNFQKPECQTFTVVTVFLKNLTNRLIEFVLAIAFIFLIVTGYQFVTSMGNKEGMESAKRSLLFITIGILVVLSAFLIVRFVSDRFLNQSAGPPPANEPVTKAPPATTGLPLIDGAEYQARIAAQLASGTCSLNLLVNQSSPSRFITTVLGIGTARADDGYVGVYNNGASNQQITTIIAVKSHKKISAYASDGSLIFSKPANFGVGGASTETPYVGDQTTPITAQVKNGQVIPLVQTPQGKTVDYFTFDGKLRSSPAIDGCYFERLASEIPEKFQGQFQPNELLTDGGKMYYSYKIAMKGIDSGGNSVADRAILIHAGRDNTDLQPTLGCIRVSPYVLHDLVQQSSPSTKVVILDDPPPAGYRP